MGRSPCCDESGLKKGPWTPEEDEKLQQYIQKNGHGSWRTLPRLAGTVICSSCSWTRESLELHTTSSSIQMITELCDSSDRWEIS